VVTIDRLTGDITASRNGGPIDMKELGRIAAQTAKQVMIQKIREAERGSIFEEFSERKGTIVTGTVSRYEGGALVVNLGRAEGFLPKSEQIPGETQHPGERIRCLILDVREAPHQVKIVLSRSHPDFIRRLFELEVPEVSERIIEVRALAREAGYRTKIAVSSIDTKVDAVGACVGVRGSRIKNIVAELGGEKIDIVRWNESSQILITNALKPAEVTEVALCFELGRATVVVPEDQLSLAIGKRGQNVRLAARLTGWDIDILTPAEYNKGLDEMEKVLSTIEGINNEKIEKMMAMGIISLMDVEEVGTAPLVKVLTLDEQVAQRVVSIAGEAAKRLAAEKAQLAAEQRSASAKEPEAAPEAAAEVQAAEAPAPASVDGTSPDRQIEGAEPTTAAAEAIGEASTTAAEPARDSEMVTGG
jgi:N utilization substance protein A